MKNKLIYIVILIFSIPLLISCDVNVPNKLGGNAKKTYVTPTGTVMINKIDTVMDVSKLDSFCDNESIPSAMDEWKESQYIDENGEMQSKYMFISKMDSLQCIYTIMIDKSTGKAKFIKRITYNAK